MDENTRLRGGKDSPPSVRRTCGVSCFPSSRLPGTMLLRGLRCSGATNITTNSRQGGTEKILEALSFAYRMLHVFLPRGLLLYTYESQEKEGQCRTSGRRTV